ncbi:MAG: hypothetical protein C4290_11250 [Chloroflexota bacterium]
MLAAAGIVQDGGVVPPPLLLSPKADRLRLLDAIVAVCAAPFALLTGLCSRAARTTRSSPRRCCAA